MTAAAGMLNPQAPRAGWIKRVLGPLYVTGVFWYRFWAFGVRIVPGSVKGPAIAVCALVFTVLLRRIGHAIRGNLAVVLGPCGWWQGQVRVWRTLRDFAWCVTERTEQLFGLRTARAELEDPGVWQALGEAPGGFVFVTAHVGGWESGSFLPAHASTRRVHLVREPEMDPRAQEFVQRQLARLDPARYVTHFAHDDATLGVELLAALRRGEIVALQGDRPRAGQAGVPVQLFGRTVEFPAGPAALARAAEVPLVPVFAFRIGRLQYRVSIRKPIVVARSADREADVRAALQQLAVEIEAAIRARPHHWFCFAPLWT